MTELGDHVLLVLDDLHAADLGTFQLLYHLAPTCADRRLRILVTVRDEQLPPVMFFAVLQEGRWPPGPAWLFPPVEPMTWGVVPPGPRGAVGDADERPDYRPAWRNARPLAGGRSA